MKVLDAQKILNRIDAVNVEDYVDEQRQYIGPSSISHPCDAYLAFCLRGFPNRPPEAKLLRIFRDGHRIEEVVLEDLRRAYPDNVVGDDGGSQFEFQYRGHTKGHVDGLWYRAGKPAAILEIKSMGFAPFEQFEKYGVRFSHPYYYGQVQAYMGLSGLKQAIVIAYNKNNAKYHAELVKFDEFEWAYMRHRIERVMSGQARKLASDNTYWKCRECWKSEACWNGVLPEPKCAACAHAKPLDDGSWHCTARDTAAIQVCEEYTPYHPREQEQQ